jgi:hypothetical protein
MNESETTTRLETLRRAPFAGGAGFGAAGVYERIDGRLHFAVDPLHPANAGIVDLARAARDGAGRVHFAADLCLLQPVDPAGANGRLLLEVPNRGRKGIVGRINRPAAGESGTAADAAGEMEIGDGLLLRQGWTVAWCGWQWDVIRGDGPDALVGFDAPVALDVAGAPLAGQVMLEWQPDALQAQKLLADRVHQPYPAATPDEAGAVLTAQDWPGAPRRTVPRERWRFARAGEDGAPLADDSHIWLEGGFQPGVIYDLVYTTRACPVVGAGLLALRDGPGFLRYAGRDAGNPAGGRIENVLGTGSSQCGRLLRNFLYLGLNADTAGRRVYDGLLINVAGSRRGEFNHRYAQPSVITIPSFGYLPPFDFDGLLRRQREVGGVPRIMAINSSSEYWNREASLIHTDAAGGADADLPPEVRVYHFAGTKHGPGTLQPQAGEPAPAPGPAQRANVVDSRPLLRALFFALDRWVVDGVAPPLSVYPRLADGTAATPDEVLTFFRDAAIPGTAVPDPARLYRRRALDLGPAAGEGAGRYPPLETGEPYRWYVPAVDADGNERAGIALPDVAVPVATHTGWRARRPGTGGEGQNIDMAGITVPFAPDAATRQRLDDPRPSIAERYPGREAYVTLARRAAARLVAGGYLLEDDLEQVVQNAAAGYDAFAGSEVAAAAT